MSEGTLPVALVGMPVRTLSLKVVGGVDLGLTLDDATEAVTVGIAEGNALRLNPCIPADWPGFKIRYRYGETTFHISVVQAPMDGRSRPAMTVVLDGVAQPNHTIPLVDDRRGHVVEVGI